MVNLSICDQNFTHLDLRCLSSFHARRSFKIFYQYAPRAGVVQVLLKVIIDILQLLGVFTFLQIDCNGHALGQQAYNLLHVLDVNLLLINLHFLFDHVTI